MKDDNRKKLLSGIVIILLLLIIIIVLAAVYGTDLNCTKKAAEAAARKEAMGPPMTLFPNIMGTTGMVKLGHTNAKAWMKTVAYSLVPGKEMQGGVLKMEAGPALMYTHWYESILFVLAGGFRLSNGTGKFFTVNQGQSLYIPRGSEVSYTSVAPTSWLYYVIQPPTAERSTAIQASLNTNPPVVAKPPAMSLYPNIPLFPNKFNSKSYLVDLLVSKVKGAGMTGGLYKLLSGPALDYTYEYEELKLITNGVFHLQDGTGQKVVAKAGDLMYFPHNCSVHFTSPNFALGFYVGQRAEGEA